MALISIQNFDSPFDYNEIIETIELIECMRQLKIELIEIIELIAIKRQLKN